MLRYLRIDRPGEQRPLTRRLAIQRLEERLTLSSSANLDITTTFDVDSPENGGFVDVGVLALDATLNGDIAVPFLINNGGRLFLSFNLESPVTFNNATDGDVAIGSSDSLGVEFDLSDVWTSDLNVKVIPPPGFFPPTPEGGLIEIAELTKISDPLANEAASPETAILKSKAPLSLVTKQAREVTLNRGRDISFNVATLAPPRSIVSHSRVTLGERGNLPSEAARTEAASRTDSDVPSREADVSSDTIVPSTAQSSADGISSAMQQAGAIQPSHGVLPASRFILKSPDRGEVSADRVIATTPSVAATPLLASQPNLADSAEEEARSQIFADWRNRDLLALPVLIALATGPRVVRRRRDLAGETQQLPPHRSR